MTAVCMEINYTALKLDKECLEYKSSDLEAVGCIYYRDWLLCSILTSLSELKPNFKAISHQQLRMVETEVAVPAAASTIYYIDRSPVTTAVHHSLHSQHLPMVIADGCTQSVNSCYCWRPVIISELLHLAAESCSRDSQKFKK